MNTSGKTQVILLDVGGTLIVKDDEGHGVLNQEVIDFVLANKDAYRFVLVSDTTLPIAQTLQEYGIADIFELVITAGTDRIDKSLSETYTNLSERLGVAPSACLLIDDNEEFCAAARGAGMRVLHYHRGPIFLNGRD